MLPKRPDGARPARKPPNEAERLAALRSYEILDTAAEQAFDEIVFLASYVCKTPVALITLVDDQRQWFKAKVGVAASETHRDLAFCAHAILEPDRMLEVPDTAIDERFSTNPFVTGDPNLRFYAGVPLVTPDGFALGTLCTLDRIPRRLDDDQRRALQALATEVTTQLELRRVIAVLQSELAVVRSTLNPPPGVGGGLEDRVRVLLDRMLDLQRKFEAQSKPKLSVP